MIGVKNDAPRRVTVNGAQAWLQRNPTNTQGGVKPLSTIFKSGGFQFQQLDRVGRVALFVKRKRPNTTPSYEVVRIRRLRAHTIFGIEHPASEAMPPSERWGVDGWTYCDLDRACTNFRELTQAPDRHPLCTHPPVMRCSV